MKFLPRKDILSYEELLLVCQAFVELGVEKIRITGGEPLIRHDIASLIKNVSGLSGVRELALTTNGTQLSSLAGKLRDAGLQRINVSLDSLNSLRFKKMTRVGDLQTVLDGLVAAKASGFEKIKINSVILKNRNDDEIFDLADFAVKNEFDLTFIEEMPLGIIDDHERAECFISSDEVRKQLSKQYELQRLNESSGGPAKYYSLKGVRTRLGFISPHSENFCESCNRVRVTAEGRLLLCLGNEHSIDLKQIIREQSGDVELLKNTIVKAMEIKPEQHYFDLNDEVQIVRFMNMTGG